ncbi:hypothetical protein [Paraeggerthella hongkongensis]|uniref:Uncharacterized protein n=1 Tax=Paraeggerthella hongkongensis TaxID=230658 RepID=A0A3N0BE82_9ACTN|nr:hypothetical protein [Paraeggerthella hongkongensis]RNL46018.1 hypothetical protein DMP08_04740 [Paraeggerthella hongkongensis]
MKPKRFIDALINAASGRQIMLIALFCILAAITVACCLCGCLPTPDSGDEASAQTAPQSNAAASDSPNDASIGDGVSTSSEAKDAEAVAANSPTSSDASSQSPADTEQGQSGSSSNQAEAVSSGTGQTSGGSSANADVTASVPEKVWVVDYEQIWVEDAGAWDEQTPVYGYVEKSVCNICGAEITGNETAHGKAHMLAGGGSGHHTEVSQVITGYSTTHHDAVCHYETVENGGHWE